jgi:hypothetical protein
MKLKKNIFFNDKIFRQNIKYFSISCLFVLLGYLFFHQRKLFGDSLVYTLGIDEINYINLADGLESTSLLHSCRFFLPLIFKNLPFSSLNQFFIINLASFVFLFFSLIKFAKEYQIPDKIIYITFFVFLSCFSVSYNFTNFYLTDLPALTTIILFFISIIRKSYFQSLFWISLSLLIRESAIIFAPIFFIIFSTKKSIFSTLIIILIYVLPKVIISGVPDCGIVRRFNFNTLLSLNFYIKFFLSYSSIWFLGLIGLYSIKNFSNYLYKLTIVISILTILGTFFSSWLSVTDVTRMNFLSFPILFLGLSFLLNKIIKHDNNNYFIIFLILSGYLMLIGLLPNLIIDYNANSLSDFAHLNYKIILIGAITQFIISLFLINKYIKIK